MSSNLRKTAAPITFAINYNTIKDLSLHKSLIHISILKWFPIVSLKFNQLTGIITDRANKPMENVKATLNNCSALARTSKPGSK